MDNKDIVVFVLVILCQAHIVVQAMPRCDTSKKVFAKEGSLGSIADFPWLGVLKVHLHYESSPRVAITALALVKEDCAVANAHDVARIPRDIFLEDSWAVFAHEGSPWQSRPRDLLTHPEYQLATANTLALVLLQPWPDQYYPMRPICWPEFFPPNENSLYVVGLTDENMVLEKSMYRVQPIRLSLCQEFYKRAGLSEGLMTPVAYQCAVTQNSREHCVWENGMMLVSNATGIWTLVGMGVQGPGCGAPARFIQLAPYRAWLTGARRAHTARTDARRQFDYSVPMHKILSFNGTDRMKTKHSFAHWYPMYSEVLDDLMDFNITRINQSAIMVHKLGGGGSSSWGSCRKAGQLLYRDSIKIEVRNRGGGTSLQGGTVVYKISVYDLTYMNYTCAKLAVEASEPETAYLYYKAKMEVKHAFVETPKDLIRFYVPKDRVKDIKEGLAPGWRPNPVLKPAFLEDLTKDIEVENINIEVKIRFKSDAWLHVQIYGKEPEERPTTTTKRRTRTRPKHNTKDPYNVRRRLAPLPTPGNRRLREEKDFVEKNGAVGLTVWFWMVFCSVLGVMCS